MGSINMSLDWEEQELSENLAYIGFKELHYYTRQMKKGRACQNDYASHILLCFFKTERELRDGWEKLNNYVAVGLQRNVENLIEKSNFYICCFVEGSIGRELRHEIEGDSFCAKKYLFETVLRSEERPCRERVYSYV